MSRKEDETPKQQDDDNEHQPLIGPSTPHESSVLSSKKVTLNLPDDYNTLQPNEVADKSRVVLPTPPPFLKTGIGIMLFITFLSSVCFAIVLPSIWAFIQAIEGVDAKQSYVGWAVACNSAGSFLASPIIGYWGDKRTSREAIGITLVVMIVGNVLYGLANNVYLLLAARFIVGVSCANYAVAQTYISYATTTENRSLVMALNSACTVLGFIVGPALALVLDEANFNVKGVQITSYNSPGYLAALLSIIGLVILFWLKEVPASYKKNKNKKVPEVSQRNNSKSSSQKFIENSSKGGSSFYAGQGSIKSVSQIFTNKNIPRIPVFISLYTYFAMTLAFTTFETIGSPYTETAYHWTSNRNGVFFAVMGILCVVSLIILQVFLKFFGDRTLVLATLVISIGGFGIMLSFSNGGYVSLPRFISGAMIAAMAYATGTSLMISIYSKVLEAYDQGMMMGWMSSASSISRIVGPIACSYTLQFVGPSIVFLEIMSLAGVAFFCLAVGYSQLTPATTSKDAEPING